MSEHIEVSTVIRHIWSDIIFLCNKVGIHVQEKIGTQKPPSQALAQVSVARRCFKSGTNSTRRSVDERCRDHASAVVPVTHRWILASNLVQTAHVRVSTNDGSCTICRTHHSPLDLASNLVQTAHVKVSMNDGSCTICHTAQ